MTGEAGAPGEKMRELAREVVLSVMHDYDAWSPEAEYQRFRATLIEVVRAALARVEAETLERAGNFIDTLADLLDERATKVAYPDFTPLLHGILTDNACAMRNLAESIRALAPEAADARSTTGEGGGDGTRDA